MKIDKILQDAGWESNPDFKYYSSITQDVRRGWKKNGKYVVTGLNVKGYPPTLISPLPKEVIEEMDSYNKNQYVNETYNYLPEDPFTLSWIERKSEDEIKEWLESL